MKKLLNTAYLLLLTLMCMFGLTACDGADVTSLTKTQSVVEKEFNELATLIKENSNADDAIATMLNDYSDTLADVAAVCKDPSGYDQAAIDEIEAGLKDMQAALADLAKEIQTQTDVLAQDTLNPVTVDGEWPYDHVTQEQIAQISDILKELQPLYNQAFKDYEANGWEADDLATQEINTIYAVVVSAQYGVADPSDYADEDPSADDIESMDEVIAGYQQLLDAMPAFMDKVSQSYQEE